MEPGEGRRSQTYETVRPGSPSVWQYIVDAQKLQAATFSKLDADKDGVLTAQELQQVRGGWGGGAPLWHATPSLVGPPALMASGA